MVVPVLAEEVGEDLRRPDLAVAADELDDLLPVIRHEGHRAKHVTDVAVRHTKFRLATNDGNDHEIRQGLRTMGFGQPSVDGKNDEADGTGASNNGHWRGVVGWHIAKEKQER